MPRQAYVSISDLAWDAMGCPEFEMLKSGFIGQGADGQGYRITSGIPQNARLVSVIYLYEDDTLPNVANPFAQSSATVMAERFSK